MHPTDRFISQAPRRQMELQPDCPVYVHCTCLSREKRSGAEFVQLRLVNCSDKQVSTVSFAIEALDAFGQVSAVQGELVLADCKAQPGGIFGEDKIFALQLPGRERLRVVIKRVAFADGMLWRGQPESQLLSPRELGWTLCSCGLPNGPERKICPLCGRTTVQEEAEEEFFSIPIPEPIVRPAPIVRRELPVQLRPDFEEEEDEEDEEDESVPAWLSVLLCIFGALAILAVLGFVAFYLQNYVL